MDQNKVHYIAITGIIQKDDKFLICKRGDSEKVFPGKWCVPGGKLEVSDFINTKKDTADHWFDVLEKALQREIKEETALEIENIGYCSNLALLRPNGFSTVIISLYADWKRGEVKVDGKELVEHAWVTVQEAKNYDLIENIWEQLEKVEGIKKIN